MTVKEYCKENFPNFCSMDLKVVGTITGQLFRYFPTTKREKVKEDGFKVWDYEDISSIKTAGLLIHSIKEV